MRLNELQSLPVETKSRMPRSGGTAAKFGDRYEGQWTVFCLTDVLLGEAVSIRREAPGEDGFEFWLQRPSGHREFHQT